MSFSPDPLDINEQLFLFEMIEEQRAEEAAADESAEAQEDRATDEP